MTAPTPDFILGWHAAIEAAVDLFHDEQMTAWSNEIMADMALGAGVQPEDYDGVVGCYRAIRETLTEIANAIRSLPPPGDLRAALEAMVKPLVWEGHSDDQRSGDYVITPSYGQGPKRLLLARGSKLVGWFDELELARAAAEADNCRRAVASIMGDEG